MSEAESQYHPAVEKVVETSGPNIGNVKDEGLAHEMAAYEDAAGSGEGTTKMHDEKLMEEVGAAAVAESALPKWVAKEAAGSSTLDDRDKVAAFDGAAEQAAQAQRDLAKVQAEAARRKIAGIEPVQD